MNRHYTVAEYEALIARLRSRINGLTVSTDLILGFPGETEALFEDTMETLKRLNFSHIHAFPYSPRKGTPAATMEGQIDTAEKKRRVELVNELSARQKQRSSNPSSGRTRWSSSKPRRGQMVKALREIMNALPLADFRKRTGDGRFRSPCRNRWQEALGKGPLIERA